MKLINTLDLSESDLDEKVYRDSILPGLFEFLFFFFLLSLIINSIITHFPDIPNNSIVFILFGLIMNTLFLFIFSLLAWVSWTRFRLSLRSSNWLIKANSRRILVRLRSYNDYYLDDTRFATLELHWNNIKWVRLTTETATQTGTDYFGDRKTRYTYVELHLSLSEKDLKEISTKLGKGGYGNSIAYRKKKQFGFKYDDYPVMLKNGLILRVRWNSIRPKANKMLEYFSHYTQIEPSICTKIDYRTEK